MPVAISLCESSSSLSSSSDDHNGRDRLMDLLNGNGKEEDKASFSTKPQPMDVLLDTCWALMTEIQHMDDPPAGLNKFKTKCTITFESMPVFKRAVDEKMFTKIASIRNCNDSYDIVEKIGTGAYGNVFLVKRREDGKYLAMKTISKALIFRQPDNAYFMEERLIMTQESQWLVRLEESFQDELFLYIVMEYLAGGDLSSLDEEQQGLPEEQVRFYAAEVVLALEELHSLGYAHRDVKPGNVMIGEDGHVKLTDFGSAGKVDKEGKIYSKSSVGTPDYVSPEALKAQESRGGVSYDVKCDWWGLGVMMFELLTGEPPFYAPSLVQTYQNITNHKSIFENHAELGKLSDDARDLLKHLLCGAEERYSIDQIKQHKFFQTIDWNQIRLTAAPFIPLLGSAEDTSRFFLDEDDDAGNQQLNNFLKGPSKGKRNCFEGNQLPFVGYTHCPRRVYQVVRDEIPLLQTLAGSRLMLSELEAQVEDLRISGETAKMVSEQIRRTTSHEELTTNSAGLVTALSHDNLYAAYEALLQNYEFIQTHYEELLSEHANTSRQLQGLILTMQEQELRQRALEEEIEGCRKRAALDKIKINELVNKLATTLAGQQVKKNDFSDEIKPLNGGNSTGKEKQLLKQKNQECKILEAQLRQEMAERQKLEQELAEVSREKEALESEHEALLAEMKPRMIERRPSEMFRSLLQSKGHNHVRQASSMSSSSLGPNHLRMEGWVKVLCGGKQKRGGGGGLVWEKAFLSIREGSLWIGERELVSFSSVLWVQPVDPDDLLHLGSKLVPLCFKLRVTLESITPEVVPVQEVHEVEEEMEAVKVKIVKEERILKGATQLLEAASTVEQQAVAMAHVEACRRKIAQLRGQQEQLQIASETGSITSVTTAILVDHRFKETSHLLNGSCQVCYQAFPGGSGYECSQCHAKCHLECKEILGLTCAEVSAMAKVLPTFFMASTAEEARKWIRGIEAARKHHLESL